jgi:hypothetical protein
MMAPYPRVSYSLEGQQADQSEAAATLILWVQLVDATL